MSRPLSTVPGWLTTTSPLRVTRGTPAGTPVLDASGQPQADGTGMQPVEVLVDVVGVGDGVVGVAVGVVVLGVGVDVDVTVGEGVGVAVTVGLGVGSVVGVGLAVTVGLAVPDGVMSGRPVTRHSRGIVTVPSGFNVPEAASQSMVDVLLLAA